MGLSSFSSILNFAITEENKNVEYLDSLLKSPENAVQNQNQKIDFLKKFYAESLKNHKNLQMILQENITELVMEPCDELTEADFSVDFSVLGGSGAFQVILEKQIGFYRKASASINLKEVKRAFDKISVKKAQLLAEFIG